MGNYEIFYCNSYHESFVRSSPVLVVGPLAYSKLGNTETYLAQQAQRIWLHKIAGVANADIAKILGISITDVNKVTGMQ
jgi:hypothetical protein